MSISISAKSLFQDQIRQQVSEKCESTTNHTKIRDQITKIGELEPQKASLLSRKLIMWDGSQKALDQLSAEGLNVSHLAVPRLLGGMMSEDNAYPMIEELLREEKFSEAANILCQLGNMSDFSGFKEYLENEMSNEFSSFKQALIELAQSNPKASRILSQHFGYEGISSSRGLVVPNQLKPQANIIKALNLKTKYGKEKTFSIPEEQNIRTSFYAKNGLTDQLIWKSSKPVTGTEVKKIVEFIQSIKPLQSIHINTGTHGDKTGNISTNLESDPVKLKEFAESKFFEEDINSFLGKDNICVVPVSTYTPPIYPREANHVIDAWCYSDQTPMQLGKTNSSISAAQEESKEPETKVLSEPTADHFKLLKTLVNKDSQVFKDCQKFIGHMGDLSVTGGIGINFGENTTYHAGATHQENKSSIKADKIGQLNQGTVYNQGGQNF